MLSADIINLIQANQLRAAKEGVLPQVLLDTVFDMNWFNLWVPKEYGGLEKQLIDGCRLLESLAYWDGSLGWTVTLCAGANMFAGFIDKPTAKAIFAAPLVCLGGSGRASGRAIPVSGGYRLTGRWSYATGAPHLSHFTCNAVVVTEGEEEQAESQIIKSFFVPREQVLIEYDWQTFGLEATASHSFSMQDVFVATAQCFELHPDAAQHEGVLFQYPFQPFAEVTLFVNYLGMFSRYTDLVQKNFYLRAQNPEWQIEPGKRYFKTLDVAQQFAEDARTRIYALIAESWNNVSQGKQEANEAIFQAIASDTRKGVATMKSYLLDLHIKCGIEAAQSDSELNRVFRHFFTATQHALLQSQTKKLKPARFKHLDP